MGAHLSKHGDGVKDIAFNVEDCIGVFKVLLHYWVVYCLKMILFQS